MLLRQLFDQTTSTYTYLLADTETREAIFIDTVFEQFLRDLALIRELKLKLKYTLETHTHADHVTAAWLFKSEIQSQIIVSEQSGVEGADVYVKDRDVIQFGKHRLEVRSTPGHTDGCTSFVLSSAKMAFTGDALLIRGAGRTDFQQGDAARLYTSVHQNIFSLPDDTLLYPGHDYSGRTVTTVLEEKQFNPRLALGTRVEDFVGYMNNLGLPHPAKINEAVPANLRAGRPLAGEKYPQVPNWAPIVRTFAGVNEISPDWVHEHLREVTLLDVREKAEVEVSTTGRIPGSVLFPLSELRSRMGELKKEKPIVTICPAGARSAQAALILEKAGFLQVANLPGGLLRWKTLGFPIELRTNT